jgi:pyruvate/2-oxoglutarate dehydrogenase complex dihydrolipoamide acyltransferase (E2) component
MVEINLSAEVRKLAEERGIPLEQVREVVQHGEETKEKLLLDDQTLAKKRIGTTTVYVVYRRAGEAIDVVTVYSHRMEEKEVSDFVPDDVQPWRCGRCNKNVVRASMNVSYLGITRQAPAMACPDCGVGFFEEHIVNKTLCTAMCLFEKKRA